MNRLEWICLWCVLLCSGTYICGAARPNRTLTGSVIFPDYPPSSLNAEELEEDDGELKTFQEVETKIKAVIDDVIKKVLPFVIRSSADIRLSGKCMASIFKVVIGMQKLQEWAIRMVDASGKPPSGVFQGTTMSLGDFDECVNVRVGKMGKPPAPGEREYFHGKYCTVELKPPRGIMVAIDEYENTSPAERYNTSLGTSKTFLNLLLKYGPYLRSVAFRFAICMPSTCNEDDLSSITSTIARQVGVPINVLHCQEKRKVEFRTEQVIIIVVLAAIIGLVLLCTTAEVYFNKFGVNPLSKFQVSFQNVSKSISAVSSTKKLVDVKDRHPFPVLRGLFLVTVVITVLGHTYLMYNHLFFFKFSSVINYLEYLKDFAFSFIANGSNGLENYFFIAGFLITFVRWKKAVDTPSINLKKLILKPYIRMTVAQLLLIAIFLLLPIVGYGPFWGDFVGPYLEGCRQKWWLNLLYIQNYWSADETCLYHTWLLAAMMQLYVGTIIILWFLIKKPNFGILLILLCIIGGMVGVGVTVFAKDLPPALTLYFVDGISGPKMWNDLFIKPFDHVGSFGIGLLTGYAVAKHKDSFKFGRLTTAIIWCVAGASCLAVLCGLYEYRNLEKMEPSLGIVYAMVNRNIYTLFWAWFVIACVHGKAGYIPDILAWKAFVPLYRLSFLVYLLHLIIIIYHVGILRERVYMSHEENIINYFGYLMAAFILSYFCYIFFQVPYMYLESLVWPKNASSEDFDTDADKDVKYKFSDNFSLNTKSNAGHLHTISINAIKDNHI